MSIFESSAYNVTVDLDLVASIELIPAISNKTSSMVIIQFKPYDGVKLDEKRCVIENPDTAQTLYNEVSKAFQQHRSI